MENRRVIQNSLNYIEENLKTEITANELADLAGFYRAFKREFGYTPSSFLKKFKTKKPYKINLFEEEHIMVSHKKISELLKYWNLEKETISDIYYESSGNKSNNSYYVGTDYVIKFTPHLGKLKNHIVLSKSIENVGLFAATPIKTKDDSEYIQNGELYFCLTRRLDGRQINADDMYEGDYKEKARFVGEIIGQLHLALEKADAAVNEVNLYENVVNWALPKAKELLNLPDKLCNDYQGTFGKLYTNLPIQIIHRDPNPGNIICNNDKWGFIDFELSEKNLRIYDPCYAATAILSESFSEHDPSKFGKWLEMYQNIIYGYDNVVKLREEEYKSLPYVILSNQLICVAWFSEQEKYKDMLEINQEMTNWLIANFDKIKID